LFLARQRQHLRTLVRAGDQTLSRCRPEVEAIVSDEPGVQLFAFHGNVNKELEGLEAGQMSRDVTKAKNGRWVFKDDRLKLSVGDVINYWLYVQHEGLGYHKLDQSWTVTGEWPQTFLFNSANSWGGGGANVLLLCIQIRISHYITNFILTT
jgi:hypothetical protein